MWQNRVVWCRKIRQFLYLHNVATTTACIHGSRAHAHVVHSLNAFTVTVALCAWWVCVRVCIHLSNDCVFLPSPAPWTTMNNKTAYIGTFALRATATCNGWQAKARVNVKNDFQSYARSKVTPWWMEYAGGGFGGRVAGSDCHVQRKGA